MDSYVYPRYNPTITTTLYKFIILSTTCLNVILTLISGRQSGGRKRERDRGESMKKWRTSGNERGRQEGSATVVIRSLRNFDELDTTTA